MTDQHAHVESQGGRQPPGDRRPPPGGSDGLDCSEGAERALTQGLRPLVSLTGGRGTQGCYHQAFPQEHAAGHSGRGLKRAVSGIMQVIAAVKRKLS